MPVNDYLKYLKNEMPNTWNTADFSETILHQRVDVGNVKKQNYMESGKFPIIDQGQEFIAGYSNDDTLVYDGELPIIIFGDHTRIFKFIDFPFICGADGTKVLQPNQKIVNPKYFYFALKMLDIPSKGYNRHYRLLKEQKIPIPPLPEQRAIAYVLSTVRQAIDATEGVIAAARELKCSMMKHLFTYGSVPVDQADQVVLSETEVGEIPENWRVLKVDDFADIISGGTPLRGKQEYWQGDIPWVKTGEIDYKPIKKTEESITKEGLQNSSAKMIPAGTLIMAMYGQGVTRGKVAILGIDAALNQACAAFLLKEDILIEYLRYYFSFAYKRIRKMGHGAHQKNLSATIIKTISVAIPTYQEQEKIVRILSTMENKIIIEEKKIEALENLFNSLLHNLVTGKVRVQH